MPKILVVDDTSSMRQLLEFYLIEEGINVITSSNGEDALKKVSEHKFNAVITDVVMPGMSGLELCRKIKSIPEYSEVPILACSTRNTDLDFLWAKKNGISSYIVKPIDRQKFIESIKLVLESSHFDSDESKTEQEYIQDFVETLNHIISRSRKYLGPKVSDKYLWLSRPDFKWLNQFQMDANKIKYVEDKSCQRNLNEVHEHHLRKWLHKFLTQCSQTILNFESELEPNDLECIKKLLVSRVFRHLQNRLFEGTVRKASETGWIPWRKTKDTNKKLLDYTILDEDASKMGSMLNSEPLLTWTEGLA